MKCMCDVLTTVEQTESRWVDPKTSECYPRRRRKCVKCGKQWFTYETLELPQPDAALELADLKDALQELILSH
jgi:transcriptional regulator NrdR family protein